MARSQLLKDLVGGKENIESILLRLKVILSDLENESIINWVNGELQGYKVDEIPSYRILKGMPMGTFVVNGAAKYTNASIPLNHLIPSDFIDELTTLNYTDSVAAIQNILNGEQRENVGRVIPTDVCHAISTNEVQIAGMNIKLSSNQLDGIVSNVKTKLVDVVMELERNFDNLDDLDIKSQMGEEPIDTKQVVYNIQNILYDGSISVGDKNKLKKSSLGHWLRKKGDD